MFVCALLVFMGGRRGGGCGPSFCVVMVKYLKHLRELNYVHICIIQNKIREVLSAIVSRKLKDINFLIE